MKTRLPFRWLAAACVLVSLHASASPTGPEIAQLINNRYQSTGATCAVSQPAWYCNGVLVQASTRPEGQTFWEHDATATALGAESARYLRQDLAIRSLDVHHGVIFSDRFTATGNGKALNVLCSYPFAQVLDATRTASGCGLPTQQPRLAGDVSSCAQVGVSDSAGWLAHFQATGNQPEQQCSLNAQDARQFDASLKAHEGLGSEWSARSNQVQIANWDSTVPMSVPVQALFYDKNQTGTLIEAQKDQRDWFATTGEWLPVLRMDLNETSGQVFGFNLQDQLYIGYAVAARLNARYNDDRSECTDGRPAYYCDGVLFRSNTASTAFHAWDPSPGSIENNGVSFSYARKDILINRLVFNRPYGFTFKELAAPSLYAPTLSCAYPYDAATTGSTAPCTFRGDCKALGITSVALWMEKYSSTAGRGCAFGNDVAQFQLHIEVRKQFPNQMDWNEIMIATWPTGIPEQLPLESLFYQGGSTGMPQAQFIQNDYYQQTQRFLPLLKMDLAAPEGWMFSFNPAEQFAPGVPVSRSLAPHSSEPSGLRRMDGE